MSDEKIRDCFDPPENLLSCSICGDEFGMNDPSMLRNHLKFRHQGEYARCTKDE